MTEHQRALVHEEKTRYLVRQMQTERWHPVFRWLPTLQTNYPVGIAKQVNDFRHVRLWGRCWRRIVTQRGPHGIVRYKSEYRPWRSITRR